jgi:hypothetical protein
MTTSRLETIKIWGCWSLRWLPHIRMYSSRPAVIEVEKDVWDALEWMGCQPVITLPFTTHPCMRATTKGACSGALS